MNKNYQKIVESMPFGLKRATLRELMFHIGAPQGIEREDLYHRLIAQKATECTTDRQMRVAIEYWRSQGIRICHFERQIKEPNKRLRTVYFYYIAVNEGEYQEFRARYKSYANTINKVINSMDAQEPKEDIGDPGLGAFQPEMI